MDRRSHIVDDASCFVAPAKCSCSYATRQDASSTFHSRSGQAMAEFLVGLVGIMLLVVGLQQIAILSEKNFEMHHKVRGDLAVQMTESSSPFIPGFSFATKTDLGADGKAYTGDDQVVVGTDDVYTGPNGLMSAVDYGWMRGTLWDYAPPSRDNDPYNRLAESGFSDLSKKFEMFYAEDRVPVEVVPFLRRLLGRDSINLRQQAWMPALDGLME